MLRIWNLLSNLIGLGRTKKVKGSGAKGTKKVKENGPLHVTLHPGIYGSLFMTAIIVYSILGVVAYETRGHKFFENYGLYMNGWTLLILVCAHILLSLWNGYVAPEESGGLYFYGLALVPANPGLHFAPFGFMQMRTVTRNVKEWIYPGPPDMVFHGPDSDTLPEGKVRPLRIITRAPKNDEKGILDVQMTVVISFVIQYLITDIFDFIARVGNETAVQNQLREIAKTALAQDINTRTVGGVITDLAIINENLAALIADRTKDWAGITIKSARINSPDIGREVSLALEGIPTARADKTATITKAEGERQRLELVGTGQGKSEQEILKGRAKGMKDMVDALQVDGNTVIANETARNVLPQAGSIIVGAESGMADLLRVAAAGIKLIQKEGGKP